MAGAAAAQEKPTVRPAEAEPADEIYEIEDIPEGVKLEVGDEPADKTAVEETPETEEPAKGKAKAAKKPQAAKDKDEDRLPASTREEREKRKKYAKLWEETEAEKEKLEAQLRAARGQQQTVSSKLTAEQRAALKEKANKAETMGDLLEVALEEIERREARLEAVIKEERFNRFLHVSEAMARGRHSDYDLVLKAAGILDAVAVKDNGQFVDPVIANMIYNHQDPSEKAYAMAYGKLEKEGRLDEVLGTKVTQEKSDPDPDEGEVEAEPKRGSKSEKASDERRAGAREVIEAVSGNSSKPRGLTALKQATPPKRGVTRKDLDRMAEEDPNGLATLFKSQPKLKEWWLGGIESA
jgi:hypothetical protein